eukprot:2693149-Karenia_brevis.AAC.1
MGRDTKGHHIRMHISLSFNHELDLSRLSISFQGHPVYDDTKISDFMGEDDTIRSSLLGRGG